MICKENLKGELHKRIDKIGYNDMLRYCNALIICCRVIPESNILLHVPLGTPIYEIWLICYVYTLPTFEGFICTMYSSSKDANQDSSLCI